MDKKSKNQKSEYNIVNSLLSQQGMAMKYQNLLYGNGVVVSFVFTFLWIVTNDIYGKKI